MKRISQRVMFATLVLVVAVAGAAVAAGTITGNDIKNNTITGKDVKDRSLTPKDFKGSLQGPQGIQGPQGLRGVTGPGGPTVLAYELGTLTVAAAASDAAEVHCPAGYFPTGGGAFSDDESNSFVTIAESGAVFEPNGWLVVARNTDPANSHDVFIAVSCVKPTQVTGLSAAAAMAAGAAKKAGR
jgi:hypothetical protein